MDDDCQLLTDSTVPVSEEDDQLVTEVDIYLTRLFADQLYLFQYPLRPAYLDFENVIGARLKPKNKLVQFDYQLDNQSNFHSEHREKIIAQNWSLASNELVDLSSPIDHLTLSSSNAALGENYKRFAVGMLTSNGIQLSPLNAIFQMRPNFDLTLAHTRIKQMSAVSDDDDDDEIDHIVNNQLAKQQSSTVDDSATEDDQSYKLITMKFWRPEGRFEREKKLRSYNYLERARNEERWIDLAYFSANQLESIELRRKWTIDDKYSVQRLPVRWRKTISIDDYFQLLLMMRGQQQISLTNKEPAHLSESNPSVEQKPVSLPTTKATKTTKTNKEKSKKSKAGDRTSHKLASSTNCEQKQVACSSNTPLSSISLPQMIIKPDPETIQNELLSFMKRRFGYRPYFKLSEINIAIKLELISSPPGHLLATGVTEASILRSATEIGAIHLNKKWPKNLKQEPVFINMQMGDKYDTLRRYVADLLERSDGFQFSDLRLRVKQENQTQLFPVSEVKKFVKDHCITRSSRKGVLYCVKGTLVK